jgi:outer membrane protein
MKHAVLLIVAIFAVSSFSYAQKFAYVDTEYILSNIPSYKAAQDEINKQAEQWKAEVDALYQEIDKMYKDYQAEKPLLTQEMRSQREEEIVKKEQAAKQLQNDYFGQEGLLYKKRTEKISPIQDEIYNALKEISNEGGYALIFDTSSGPTILYSNPRYDISDQVLERLGYKN